jgi:transketolase
MTAHELSRVGNDVRRRVLRAVHHAGAGHIGGVFSAADMLAALYFQVLNIDPRRPDWPDRDRFILSKGHCAIGLYAVLALRGYFDPEELNTFDAIDSRLQGHPDMTKLPGLDMSTGSLGQGLSPGLGLALGARLLGKPFRTWVMLGDGEIQEGQVWEAAFCAARYEVDNLIAILDWNHLQQFGWPVSDGYASIARRDPADRPCEKWRAFGWHVVECDGHDIPDFLAACADAQAQRGRPSIIVARTVKGKGVSFMENDYTWHSRPLTSAEVERALSELGE